MKIVGWNLLNVGNTKLGKAFTAGFQNLGLGNNIIDYIVNLVMADGVWNNLGLNANPADVFVVIELKTGGKTPGNAVSGTCVPTLTTIVNALNHYANNNGHGGTHQYAYANPLITGNHESVGIIFNTFLFNAAPVTQALRTDNNQNIKPRTPFMATLIHTATGDEVNIVGIHAPPVKGGAGERYKPPIQFMNKMASIDELDPTNVANPTDYFIMGDFNCNPSSSYDSWNGNKKKKVFGFVQFTNWGYDTDIPNGTLSSLRIGVNNNFAPPANYLSDAYDNLFYQFHTPPVGGTNGGVLNLIANGRNFNPLPPLVAPQPAYPGNLVLLLNNNRKVSDHLPFAIEF